MPQSKYGTTMDTFIEMVHDYLTDEGLNDELEIDFDSAYLNDESAYQIDAHDVDTLYALTEYADGNIRANYQSDR